MVAWRDLVIERSVNGGTLVGCRMDNDVQASAHARVGPATLRVWDDGLLRFHGRVREPTTARAGEIELAAGSPFTLLDRRVTPADHYWAAADQGYILDYILSEQNARSLTGLRMASYAASVTRERTYDRGKSVQEIFAQMAEVEDGPWLVEVPVRNPAEPQTLAEMQLRIGTAGFNRPDVRFEYGEGTLGNLTGYSIGATLPRNGVIVSGGDPGTGVVPIATVEAPISISSYGLFEEWLSDPDVTELDTLTEKAQRMIEDLPQATVDIDPVAAGPAVDGPPVPRLGWDFDVGDVVYITVRDGTTVAEFAGMVTEARLTVSADDDAETLALTLDTFGATLSA